MLLVQVVLLSDYPNPEAIIQLLKSGFRTQFTDIELNSAETKPKSFHLTNLTSDEMVTNRKNIKDAIGVNPDFNSLTFLIPFGTRKKISINFAPKDDSALVSTILLIRNNLTIIDALLLQGQGGNGILKIGNQLPGPKSVLSFELLEKHLKSCSKSKTSSAASSSSFPIEPTFTVHRTFSAVNVGKLSMRIKGFTIGPQSGATPMSCQGFGFKVINCGPFDLRPNENKKIHIAFTPDFTQFKVKHLLSIVTDNPSEKIEYALVATLPKHLLPHCNQSLPRPNWEAVLYYCLVTMMMFMILLAVCVAFFDGDRILNYSFYPVLTTFAVTTFDADSMGTASEDLFHKLPNYSIEDSKEVKRNTELRNRKVKTRNTRTSEAREEVNNDSNNSSIYQRQSWTQFLKKKFVRRDSSGSDKSNNSNTRSSSQTNLSKYQSLPQINVENVKKEPVVSEKPINTKSKTKKNQKNDNDNKNKKKIIYTTKQENLTNVISSPPPPLPDFDSSFDEESFYRNSKTTKKGRTSSFHTESSGGSSSLELPYKPKTVNTYNSNNVNNSSVRTAKKTKNKEDVVLDDNESYHSSNENSVIWDSPISQFDSENAMNELVRQTELFAEKSQPFEHNIKSRAKLNEPLAQSVSRESHLSSSWFRSATPPASNSQHLVDESFLERRTPPVRFPQAVERPIPSNPWLKDLTPSPATNSLDTELTHLRETSSPWNSQNHQNQSNDWNCFAGIESTKELWNTPKWTAPPQTLTSNSSQPSSLWNDSYAKNLWNAKPTDLSSTWTDFASPASESASDATNANKMSSNCISDSIDSSFNLFGRSLWSPLTTTATDTSATTSTTSADPLSTPSTTWSFTPFSLFGSSSQYNRNNDNK